MSEYRLEMKGVVKTFPGVKALDHAQLQLKPGHVHALMGENGAGKSSLFMDAMLDALLRSPGRATSLAGFATTRMPAAAPSSLHSTSATSCTALPAPAQRAARRR